MSIHVDNPDNLPAAEVEAYLARCKKMIADGELPSDICRMELLPKPDGEIEIRYYRPCDRGMDRIRRITGYLVGTLERFNDAKRAEEHDRVKHGLTVV